MRSACKRIDELELECQRLRDLCNTQPCKKLEYKAQDDDQRAASGTANTGEERFHHNHAVNNASDMGAAVSSAATSRRSVRKNDDDTWETAAAHVHGHDMTHTLTLQPDCDTGDVTVQRTAHNHKQVFIQEAKITREKSTAKCANSDDALFQRESISNVHMDRKLRPGNNNMSNVLEDGEDVSESRFDKFNKDAAESIVTGVAMSSAAPIMHRTDLLGMCNLRVRVYM